MPLRLQVWSKLSYCQWLPSSWESKPWLEHNLLQTQLTTGAFKSEPGLALSQGVTIPARRENCRTTNRAIRQILTNLFFFGGEGAGESIFSIYSSVCFHRRRLLTRGLQGNPTSVHNGIAVAGYVCCCCCSCCCCCCCCLMLVSHAKACPHFFSFSIFFSELHKVFVSPSYWF